MAATFRIAFATDNSGATARAASLTVPTGVVASDMIVITANFITGTVLTASYSTSGSGTLTEHMAPTLQGTSAQGFVYEGTGFVAGDTITITPSTLNRCIAGGVAYSGASFESAGTKGTTSTTVATSPSVTTTNANDIAVGVSLGIASATGRTFSGLTAGWASRTFVQGGSGTRFTMLQISEIAVASPGASGALTATASGALLSSGGMQVILMASGGSAPSAPTSVAANATSSSAITITWTDSTAASPTQTYTIIRGTDGTTFPTTVVSSVAQGTQTYADTGLSASTTYYYKVTATNSNGSATSSAANATTLAGGGTVRKVNVSGTATTVSNRKVNVGGTATTATRKVNVSGVAT